MVKINKSIQPDLVLLPNSTDIHQDHQTIHNEGVRAFKQTNILGYELIWNNIELKSTYFTKLDNVHIQAKVNAIMEYKSQEFRYYHTPEFIKSLSRTRGVQVNAEYAEAFELIRWIN
jgi:LmbE family N-acetylglucosaminyl deacetylase